MIGKKLLGLITSVFVLFNVAGTSAVKNDKVNNLTGIKNDLSVLPHDNYLNGGPYDLAIANEEKIIEMLKREGKIAKDATAEQIQKVYKDYLTKIAKSQSEMGTQVTKLDKSLKAMNTKKVAEYTASKSKTKVTANSNGLREVEEQEWDGAVRKDRLMVLLVDYADFKHNSIKPEDGPVIYYPDYTREHYENMIFGADGYVGPNGQKLTSMRQFYEEQSGGSYTVEGKVLGWYSVKNNAAYYGAHTDTDDNDIRPRQFIAEALTEMAKNITPEELAWFDQEDRYDLDGDGETRESDGIIDHLVVIHAGVGEEAGGGSLGGDAIWSHRWNLGGLFKIPGTNFKAYDYTTEPEDGAAGVFAHEYGHDLGLPDEYDTIYSGNGEPIGNWSIMSSGSWTGDIGGTEPSGFSPYAKQFFQATMGGNWQPNVANIDYKDITTTGTPVILDQASSHGLNKNVVRVNLPDHKLKFTTPIDTLSFYSGKGLDEVPFATEMTTAVDLTGKTNAALKFKTWYDIEEAWDFASIEVREQGQGDDAWVAIKGNITTTEHHPQASVIVANGITGSSGDKWIDAEFDLTAYAGKKIELRFHYQCDLYSYGAGLYADNIVVEADGATLLSENAEGATSNFTLNGFTKNDGYSSEAYKNYYLVEWRNHQGVDAGLAHIRKGNLLFPYDPGMVVWYVDEAYTDNWTGVHPGDGFLGIADAGQKPVMWAPENGSGAYAASNGWQMHDAAFSLRKSGSIDFYNAALKATATDKDTFMHPFFDDSRSFMNADSPDTGRNIPKLGLKIYVTGEARDRSSASILIKK